MSDCRQDTVITQQAVRVMQSIRMHAGVVVKFELSCQSLDVFSAAPCKQQPPLVVAHGGAEVFAEVLAGFLHWSMPLTVYGLYQDGLAELWVADQ